MEKYTSIGFEQVQLEDGFWSNRQHINHTVTAQAVYDRFSDTHRFEALECNWQPGMPDQPHVFWDSDIAKWLEGAADILRKTPDAHLEQLCDHAIDAIAHNQDEQGYFNSHFLVTDQALRFKNRNNHELYCAGHLMEAACAYFEATGKDKFLRTMCRYADYIYDTFVVYQSAAFATGGHPEIELALVRLSKTTGEKKYLELAKHFVDTRGTSPKDGPVAPEWSKKEYDQNHMPLKRQRTAEGHSVRAMYIYSAMADIAREYGDEDYAQACQAIFKNIVDKRMYITGGVGSSCIGETFTVDYDLTNRFAYAETCAAIALTFFSSRMLLLKPDARYADAVERVMYNGALSGVSLDGKSFFYENPLEIDPHFANVNTATVTKQHMPIMERVEVFDCSCCPPNLLRFIASIGNLLYTQTGDTLFVHQYIASTTQAGGGTVVQQTTYPKEGVIALRLTNTSFARAALRIPGWCTSFRLNAPYTLKDGYAYVAVPAEGEIVLELDMPVELMEANPHVQEDAGRVAVMRGPVLYCLEGVDNGEFLRSLFVRYDAPFTAEAAPQYGVPLLKTTGLRKKGSTALYSRACSQYDETTLTFIPYFAFANRGASEMLVWVNVR